MEILEKGVCIGNTYDDTAGQDLPGERKRSWLLGNFMEDGDPRKTPNIEMSWGIWPKGFKREAWATNKTAHTLSILINGKVKLDFPEKTVVLERLGDYVLWTPTVPHIWEALEDSVLQSIRWPSVKGDSYNVEPVR